MDPRKLIFVTVVLGLVAALVLGALLWPAAPESSVERVLLLLGVVGAVLLGALVAVSRRQERRR